VVIECLDRAKKIRTEQPEKWLNIVDVCTGSGCIAVSVAKHLPKCKVTAIDVSLEAIAIANSNIKTSQLEDRVSVLESDLLSAMDDNSADFVLSNPPYISQDEFDKLEKTVRDYEPKLALVSGPTGMEIIERLADQATRKLVDEGWFICELSPMIADAVLTRVSADPHWKNPSLVKDLAGLKRIVVAQRKPRNN
jgi:release factor glutamine methyltransferase